MGKIVANFFISLDGVVVSPEQWRFPYYSDEVAAAIKRGTETSEPFLMGRRVYEEERADGDIGISRERHPRALAARERPVRRAQPHASPDRRRPRPAAVRGNAHPAAATHARRDVRDGVLHETYQPAEGPT
jgi:hypothetical protein